MNDTNAARGFDPSAVAIRPAATVMLIRDTASDTADDTGDGAATGLQVFMLRRTLAAAFGSGMYVFPGGRVDQKDGADLEVAHRLAAIRECFEEAGVLLARTPAGDHVVDGHAALLARHGVHDGTIDLLEWCEQHELIPALDELVWVSHWITPLGESRRFDTRFYLAPAPPEQTSLHDEGETIESLWVRPQEALEREAAGEMTMMPPTITNLQMLARFDSVDEAMDAAHRMPPPECVLPRIRRDAAGRVIGVAVPEDEDYDALG